MHAFIFPPLHIKYTILQKAFPNFILIQFAQLIDQVIHIFKGTKFKEKIKLRFSQTYFWVACFKSKFSLMAYLTIELISALRETAARLRNGASYAWGNHGSCNCGNLLQVVTQFNEKEILRFAHTGFGEWTELAEEYCPTSNVPINYLLTRLQELGLTPTDIHNLEYLDNREVLEQLPGGFRWLKRNIREDVILYFEAYANLMEDELQRKVKVNFKELLSHKKQYEPIFQ